MMRESQPPGINTQAARAIERSHMPRPMAVDDLKQWLLSAKHGDAVVYYKGPTPSYSTLNATQPIGAAFDWARKVAGSGMVILSQRRIDKTGIEFGLSVFEYRATRVEGKKR